MTTHPANETTTVTNGTMVNEHDERAMNRRGFLKLGGLTAGIAVVAAACVEPRETGSIPQTGTIVPAPSTSKPPFPGSSALDATYVLTGLSVEKLAIDTYTTILDRGWLTETTSADLLRRLQERHRQHAGTLTQWSGEFNQDAGAVQPNNQLKVDLVDSEIAAIEAFGGDTLQAERQTWRLILDLEDTAQQLYNRAGGTMTSKERRERFMEIGGASARQYTAAALFANEIPVPFTFVKTAPGLLPVDSYVRADEGKLPKDSPATPGTTPGSTPGTAPD